MEKNWLQSISQIIEIFLRMSGVFFSLFFFMVQKDDNENAIREHFSFRMPMCKSTSSDDICSDKILNNGNGDDDESLRQCFMSPRVTNDKSQLYRFVVASTWRVCELARAGGIVNVRSRARLVHLYISTDKIILKLVLVTLYAVVHRFQYCWFSSVLIPFFHSFSLLYSGCCWCCCFFLFLRRRCHLFLSFFLFIFSLSTLSLLSHVSDLFQLYAHERCKSRYCTKSLWHEYWTEIFNTWSKYRNKAVAYLFHFFFLLFRCCKKLCAERIPFDLFVVSISSFFFRLLCLALALFSPNQNYWVEWNS